MIARILAIWAVALQQDEIKRIERALQLKSNVPRLPDILVKALIVGEDRRFNDHSGFDPKAILRALQNWVCKGTKQGGSTIEQQLVRVLRGRYEPTVRRKLTEIALAAWLNRKISKRRIAEIYLHCAYMGWRMNGVVAASERLGLDLDALSERDAAVLIASLKYPLPHNLQAGKLRLLYQRQRYIQRQMHRLAVTIPG